MENAKEETINMQLIGSESPYKYVWFRLYLEIKSYILIFIIVYKYFSFFVYLYQFYFLIVNRDNWNGATYIITIDDITMFQNSIYIKARGLHLQIDAVAELIMKSPEVV